MSRTVIVGAGAVGLATAYELRKRGVDVLLLDRGEPGAACSAGNAGWVVPTYSSPLPAPGLVSTSIRWMARRDSPLYIRPRVDPRFSRWVWRFWRNCRPAPFQAGLRALAALNTRTMPLYDALAADGVSFEMHRAGLLFLGLTRAKVESAAAEIGEMQMTGYHRPPVLSAADLHDLEPGLSGDVAGGFHVVQERHLRPETLMAGLTARVREMGVNIQTGTDVTGLAQRDRIVTGVMTADGAVDADRVVIAAGAWSGQLARRFELDLPVEAGKGYSITVEQPERVVRHPLDLIEAHAAVTPFDGALRVAGTMELSGVNLRLEPARVAAIRRAGDRYLGGWQRGAREHVWVGMRPLTPDGLPLIGSAPGFENLYVATGHAMLGITLAPATGEALAELMTTGVPTADLSPFDPGRFARIA